MGVAKPTDQVHASHLDPVFYGAYWHCSPDYDEGDICEWRPIPFSTDLRAAWEVVEKLEPLVCRFETADGFIHLECGHWADHGECAQSEYADTEGEDPAPWSFHIHLGMLGQGGDYPRHWTHGAKYCARGATAPLAICRAALKAVSSGRRAS